MIPRYQRILFWCLSGAILLMALVLLHGCEQAREKLTRHRNETPLTAPVWPHRTCLHRPVVMSQIRTVQSAPADTAHLPSLETATE